MWFMPVIIGLYLSFPVLVKILERWGMKALLLVSVLVTYGSITVLVATGLHAGGHSADFFTFWMVQFALGMLLAYLGSSQPEALSNLIGLKAFFLGIGLYAFSWALRTYVPLGRVYNDTFTSIGIFLILLNVCWVIRSQFSAAGRALGELGSQSYIMYLVHFPIMAFLIGPLLKTPNNALIVMALGGVYIVGIFFLSRFISPPVDRLTSWSFRLFYPHYVRNVEVSRFGTEERVVVDSPGSSMPRS
jgi:peptidoglycan/LPS O-acetylase OafA/YrhL